MKIAFISLKSYPLFNPKIKSIFGGSEIQLYLLRKELTSYEKDENYFIVADYGQPEIEEINKTKIIKSIKLNENYLFSSIKLIRVIKKLNPDIIILRSFLPSSGPLTFYVSRILKKNIIFMVPHDRHTDGTYKNREGAIKSFFANLVFKYSDLIITQNEYQKRNLERKNIESVIIKSGYPIPEYIGSEKDYILWVGRSEDWKRPELLLKLAELNHNFKFVMICPPSIYNPQLSGKYKKEAQKLNNLKFIDFVPFNEINNYFQEAKVFVNTSTQEGFPNTFIQAAKNKTPIVSLNVNPDNFLNKYNCGFFCNNNFDEMNKKLNKLLKDKGLYQVMSENAYIYARENHDIKKTAKKLYELIKGLK